MSMINAYCLGEGIRVTIDKNTGGHVYTDLTPRQAYLLAIDLLTLSEYSETMDGLAQKLTRAETKK